MLIDTHTHYNFEGLKENWKSHWQIAQSRGVTHAVQIGTNMESSEEVVQLAQEEKGFFATVGVHPHDISDLDIKRLKMLAMKPKVVAIGEIGLDYFRLDRNDPRTVIIKQQQISGFKAQLELANELNLPLSLHVRDDQDEAYQDLINILASTPPKSNFVLHCVSGPDFYIEKMIKKGAWFGFDGNVTYKNADQIREILKKVPSDKVVLETDAPFLPPMPHRGKTCEPWMLTLTADYIEENFGITREQLFANSRQLFPLFDPYLLES